MILKKDIKVLLDNLETDYSLSSPPRSTQYAKLAVIELCGWIEESFDKIATRCVAGKIRTTPYQDIMQNILDKNYGFKYNSNFRRMMLQIIGLRKMEELEINLNRTGEKTILESILDTLKTERDIAAHTTTAGAMSTFQAPSVTINHLDRIYPIIRKIYSFAVREN